MSENPSRPAHSSLQRPSVDGQKQSLVIGSAVVAGFVLIYAFLFFGSKFVDGPCCPRGLDGTVYVFDDDGNTYRCPR